MLYSAEIVNAIKFGYQIEVLRGYYFTDKTTIFKDYVLQLYSLRLEYDKSHPMNMVAKLLMNSLYGRFGMDYSLESTSICTNKEVLNILNRTGTNKHVIDVEPLGNNSFIVTEESDNLNTKISSLSHHHNINVGVAAAVTALARIEMSKFKNMESLKLYYTDTDSIFVDQSPEQMKNLFGDVIGNKLGQLKLECEIEKAIFLAPKAYYLETSEGKTIVKIKGLSAAVINELCGDNVLNFDSFINVLYKDSEQIVVQNKSVKNLLESSLDIIQQTYSIKHNDNKRDLVYSDLGGQLKAGILVDTKPKMLSLEHKT